MLLSGEDHLASHATLRQLVKDANARKKFTSNRDKLSKGRKSQNRGNTLRRRQGYRNKGKNKDQANGARDQSPDSS